jgi:TPR repeat protein
MKANFWALVLCFFLAGTAQAQQSLFPTATNMPVTNSATEIAQLRAKAEKGDAAAQTEIGRMYEFGSGVDKDKAQAVKWFRKAAEQGFAAAQNNMGDAYRYGRGVETNFTEAVQWYRKAAEQGDAEGQYHLGIMYDFGRGLDKDKTEAAKWFRKAAELGHAMSQCFLAEDYDSGIGVQQDYAEAVKWYRKAAEQGEAAAQSGFAKCYFYGNGIPQDYKEAMKWYRKSAEQDDVEAQYMLGLCNWTWRGLPQDYVEAIKWFQKAADQGYPDAQKYLVSCYSALGWSYFFGKGVNQDSVEAVQWYRKAAELGAAGAQEMLGQIYYTGQEVPVDHAEARKWSLKAAEQYRKAAEQGDEFVQCQLGDCYGNMGDKAGQVKWYLKAANQGWAVAEYDLGIFYSRGEGAPKNDIEAYKWFSLAAAQGFEGSATQRDLLARTMSRTEVVEGQRLSSEFVPRKESGASNRADGLDSGMTANVPRTTGTGFFVSDDGYLLTCYHVVQDAARIAVRTKAGTFVANIVKVDRANDVALLKVAGKFRPLPVGSSRAVKLGESVFTIGFPNIELQGFAPKLTKGEISSLTGVQDDPREFQISVAVQPGNSGGPLVNQYGNVVGIVAAQLADIATLETTGSLPQNVNYAVKSSVLNVLLESLPEISAKFPGPNPLKDRKFEDVEQEAEGATALVLVY